MSSVDSGDIKGYTSGKEEHDNLKDTPDSLVSTDTEDFLPKKFSLYSDDESLKDTPDSLVSTDTEDFLPKKVSSYSDDESLKDTPDSQISGVTEPDFDKESDLDEDLIKKMATFDIKNKSVDPLEDKELIEGAEKISVELGLEKNQVDIYKLQEKGIPKEDVPAIYDVATLYKRMHDIDLMSETSNMSGILIDMAMELEDSLDLTELESITDSRKFNEKMIELLTKMNIKTALNTNDNKIIEKKHLRDELGISSYITDNKENKKNTKKDSEQIQMQSIWGIKLTEDSKSPPFICYLCGEEIINKPKKNIGIPSEMEHKKPASIVFGKYPHYDTLKNFTLKTNYENNSQEDSQETGIYSLNYTKNLIELWEDFIETNYAVMKKLYKSINGNTFSPPSINKKLNNIFDMFKTHIQEKENNNIDIDNKENGNDVTFKYCKSLITFWLYEFAYTCRDCNQVKCELDLNSPYDREKVRNKISTKKFPPNNDKLTYKDKVLLRLIPMKDRLREGTEDREDVGVLVNHFQEFETKAEDVSKKYQHVSNKYNKAEGNMKYIKLLHIMKAIRRLTLYSKKIHPTTKGGKRTRKKRRTKKQYVRRCNKTQRHRKTKKK